jgi:hypothetical protein
MTPTGHTPVGVFAFKGAVTMATRDMSEKSIGYLRLLEACGRGGCPVCRHVRDESRGHLDALLYEHVTDPDTRRTLRESWGFCNWHTWMLLEVDTSLFGASILYEDLLRLAGDRLGQLEDRPRSTRLGAWFARLGARQPRPAIVERHERRPSCSLCVSAAEAERQSLLTLVRFMDDGDLQAAYASSDPLCLPHLLRAIDLTSGSPQLQQLVQRTREKWVKVRGDLESFIEKHDYRNQKAYSDADAASYMRAFEILAGAKGLFGNDLLAGRGHARNGTSDGSPRHERAS